MDDQLVERALVAVGEHILHRPEVGGVDLDLTELVARLGLGHAHARHRRMAEYGGRDAAIIDPAGIIAEHSVGKGLALADRDRRQLHPVGDVAHRIDRSEEHTSELQSLMRISSAVFCLKQKTNTQTIYNHYINTSHN